MKIDRIKKKNDLIKDDRIKSDRIIRLTDPLSPDLEQILTKHFM
jgi:hypothetical protein